MKRKAIIMKSGINLKKEVSEGDILVWKDKGKKDLIELVTNVNPMSMGSILMNNKIIYILNEWWDKYHQDKGKFEKLEFNEKNPLKYEIPFVVENDPRYLKLIKELEEAKDFYQKFVENIK